MNESAERPSRLMVSPTNALACWTQASENEEKWACSVNAPSGQTRAGICSNRQSSHSRRCSGKVGSAKSSSPGVRNLSQGGLAPRSKTLRSRSESHRRQCNWATAAGTLSLVSPFTSHRAGEARTAAGAHRGPDVSGTSSPTRELRDQLLAMQRGHCRPIDGTCHRAGHRSNDVGAGDDRDRFLYKQQQLGGDQEPIRPTGTAADARWQL